jgi:enterochelin esterase family protein
MKPITLPSLLLAAGLASAQDMPLHEIVRPSETWQPYTGTMPAGPASAYRVDAKARTVLVDSGKEVQCPLREPTTCVVALGGSTLLVADTTDRYVWAFRIEKDGTLGPGDRYCRLRVAGDERRKATTPPEKYLADPSAMTVDAAGRTYVATNLGIQVFDPTGRLCGVTTAPPGRVTELQFDGDRLFARANGKVYVRKMLAEGAK